MRKQVIHPYLSNGAWMFDDAKTDLCREPFVGGSSQIISKLVKDHDLSEEGFKLSFSDNCFKGYQIHLEWKAKDGEGNVYYCQEYDRYGWLCPALLQYFKSAPARIYLEAQPEGKPMIECKRPDDPSTWEHIAIHKALAMRVLCVAHNRIEGAWCAYCDAVPGYSHRNEVDAVLANGEKMPEDVARALFPEFEGPYAH